jgi:cobalamin synthase
MNIALIFALICGAFVTAVLVLAFWLIMSGLKEARHNDSFTSGEQERHNKSEV